MAVSTCNPLVSICPYDPIFKVDVLLHNPLHEHVGARHEHKMEAMALCLSLQSLIKQESCQRPEHKMDKGRRSSSFNDKAGVVTNSMQQVINKSFDSLPCASFLQQSGLDRLFPKVASLVSGPGQASKSCDESSATTQYLNQMSALNHVLGLATQINQDVSRSTNLKYVAHQISVLYQALKCVPTSGRIFLRHLDNIEENFLALKTSISDMSKAKEHQLPVEVRDWVIEITDSIMDIVTSLPPDLIQEMIPVVSVLNRSM